MIDTLEVGQRIKIKLMGKVEEVEIRDHDIHSSVLACKRAEGKTPSRVMFSYPMIFAVWDQWNGEWAIFKLPAEEEAEHAELVWEQNGNI